MLKQNLLFNARLICVIGKGPEAAQAPEQTEAPGSGYAQERQKNKEVTGRQRLGEKIAARIRELTPKGKREKERQQQETQLAQVEKDLINAKKMARETASTAWSREVGQLNLQRQQLLASLGKTENAEQQAVVKNQEYDLKNMDDSDKLARVAQIRGQSREQWNEQDHELYRQYAAQEQQAEIVARSTNRRQTNEAQAQRQHMDNKLGDTPSTTVADNSDY